MRKLLLFFVRMLDICREHLYTENIVTDKNLMHKLFKAGLSNEIFTKKIPGLDTIKRINQLRNRIVRQVNPKFQPELKNTLSEQRMSNYTQAVHNAKSLLEKSGLRRVKDIIDKAQSTITGITDFGQILHSIYTGYLKQRVYRDLKRKMNNAKKILPDLPELFELP